MSVHHLGAGQQLPHDASRLGLRVRPFPAVCHAERDERGVAPAGRHEAGLAQDVGGPAPAVQGLDGDGLARGAAPCRDDDAALTLAERPSLRPSYLYPRALAMCRFRPQALGLLSGGGGGGDDDDVVDHRGDGSGSPGADRRAGAAVFLDHVAERRNPDLV